MSSPVPFIGHQPAGGASPVDASATDPGTVTPALLNAPGKSDTQVPVVQAGAAVAP